MKYILSLSVLFLSPSVFALSEVVCGNQVTVNAALSLLNEKLEKNYSNYSVSAPTMTLVPKEQGNGYDDFVSICVTVTRQYFHTRVMRTVTQTLGFDACGDGIAETSDPLSRG